MATLKPRPSDKLANLRGKTWGKMDAEEYLWIRLQGEDGEPAWSGQNAAKRCSAKLRTRITGQMISKWLQKEARRRRMREEVDQMYATTLEFFAERPDASSEMDQVVDCQIVALLARIHAEEGAEETVKAINALTSLKKAITDDRKLRQRATEWEERTEKLKAELEALRKKVNKPGRGEDTGNHMDEVIAVVDRVMGLAR